MRYRIGILLAIVSSLAVTAHATTADELIAKNAAARGGLDKIRAIRTLKAEGKLRVSGGFGLLDLEFVQYKKAPDLVRIEATVQGMTAIQSWDGQAAWQISPFEGRKDPERMSDDDARSLADDASISGPLIDYKAKGSAVDYLGTEDVDGTQAHKLKVTLKNGDIEYVYLDPDHFLEIRVVGVRKIRGTESEDVTDYGDYELVDGVYFPFSIASYTRGTGGHQQISVDEVQANTAIDGALFAFPAAVGVSK